MKNFWDGLEKYWKRITLGLTIIALLTGSGLTISSLIDWSVDVTKAPKTLDKQAKIIDSLSSELRMTYIYIDYYEKYLESVYATFQSILPLKTNSNYYIVNSETKERISVNIRIAPNKDLYVFVPNNGIFECRWSNSEQKYYFHDYKNQKHIIEKRR